MDMVPENMILVQSAAKGMTVGEMTGLLSQNALSAQNTLPSPKARLAICGLGLVGQRHAAAMAQSLDAQLIGVVDPSDAGRSAAQSLGLSCYNSLSEMLEEETPDGVVISTPTPLHVEQGETCIEHGIPVLIEKPLAASIEEARHLVQRAKEKDIAILVGHHRRHNPIIKKAKALISEGRLGQIRALQSTCWFYKPDDYFEVAEWRKLKGAGPISVNLVHDVDLMRHFCGEVLRVQAQSVPSSRGFENEELASAILTFDTGAIATVSVSDSVVSPWSWEMTSKEYHIYPHTHESCYMIAGTKGALSIPDLRLWTHPDAKDWWSPISAISMPSETTDPLHNQIRHFVEVIRGKAEPLVSGEEGLKTLEVIDAIQAAASTGETITLDHRSAIG